MLRSSAIVLSLGLLLPLPAAADELTDAAVGLCEKVKACALSQMNQEEIAPEMREMMQPMLYRQSTELNPLL